MPFISEDNHSKFFCSSTKKKASITDKLTLIELTYTIAQVLINHYCDTFIL
jgi:hypothetical protein